MAPEVGYQAAFVTIDGPGHAGTRMALREGITSFGRLPSNDVLLLGDLVSRHHARIIFFDGRASLQDLGSHNGSWVNDEQITTRALSDGDMLRIGNFNLTFRVGLMEDEAEPTADARSSQLDTPELLQKTEKKVPVPQFEVEETANAPEPPLTIPPRAPTAVMVPPSHPPGDQDTDLALPRNMSTRLSGQSPIVEEVARVQSGQSGQVATAGTLLLLYRATEALARATDGDDYLEQLLSFTLERIPSDSAVFFRVVPGEAPVRVVWKGPELNSQPQVSMSVVRWAIGKSFTVYSQDVQADLRFKDDRSVLEMGAEAQAIVCVPIVGQSGVLGALYLARSANKPYGEIEVDALEAICHLCAAGIERIELRQRAQQETAAREALARFHSPDVVERILREAGDGDGDGPKRFLEGRNATVCFFDVPGFTGVAERLSPDEVTEFLNAYLGQMSSIIFAHRGTVHKLLGDGIVAVFGAPFSYGNDAARAVAAALEMRAAFDRLAASRPSVGARHLRSGIHTGWLLTGTIGSPNRVDYALIGETVNTAARMQTSAAPGAILISEATYPLVSETYQTKKLGLQQLRGRNEPLQIFEVLGRRGGSSYEAAD